MLSRIGLMRAFDWYFCARLRQDAERISPRPAVARAGSDDHVVKTLGRRRWKQASGYHRQDRVENTFFRDTSLIGDGLRARSPAGQGSGAVLGCESLNESDDRPRPIRQQEATNVAHRERNLLRGVFPGRSARASANASATSATASPAGCVFVTTTGPTIWRTTVNRRSRSSGSRARRASCGSPKGTASRSASSAR